MHYAYFLLLAIVIWLVRRRRIKGPFEYTPLKYPNATIRLLRLDGGSQGQQIYCSFHVYRFADCSDLGITSEFAEVPSYAALSYCWGEAKRDQNITIQTPDGHYEHKITSSLSEILERLRFADRPRLIWVDQLCINQTGKSDEKASQVLLMSRVYNTANLVLICIGRDEGLAGLATTAIRDLCRSRVPPSVTRRSFYEDLPPGSRRNQVKAHVDQLSDYMITMMGLKQVQGSAVLPALGSLPRKALIEFYSQPWFRRSWTFQEVVLSRAAHVFCGTNVIDWDDVGHAAYLLEHDPNNDMASDKGSEVWHAASVTWNYQLKHRSEEPSPQLIELLATVCGHNMATDPSEQIFAFGGIASDTANKNLSAIDPALIPRYVDHPSTVTTERERLELQKLREDFAINVYTDVTRYHVHTNSSLSILSHVWHSPASVKLPRCPSWVPQLNATRPQYLIWLYNHDDPITGFHADKNLITHRFEPLWSWSPSSKTLNLKGRIVYKVESVTDLIEETEIRTDRGLRVTSSLEYAWMIKLDKLRHRGSGTLPKLAEISQILTAGRRGFGHPPMRSGGGGSDSDDSIRDHYRDHAGCIALAYEQIGKPSADRKPWLAVQGPRTKADAIAYGRQAARACVGRRFIRIEAASSRILASPQLGLGPGTVQPGDFIVVLSGARVPFVLRRYLAPEGAAFTVEPHTRSFTLVGECYVPGIMFGEVGESPRFKMEPVRDIILH